MFGGKASQSTCVAVLANVPGTGAGLVEMACHDGADGKILANAPAVGALLNTCKHHCRVASMRLRVMMKSAFTYWPHT